MSDDEDPVEVPDEVYRQLEATRESGRVNMFTEIKYGLRQFGHDEALEWVNENPDAYVEGFRKRGFAPESGDDDE